MGLKEYIIECCNKYNELSDMMNKKYKMHPKTFQKRRTKFTVSHKIEIFKNITMELIQLMMPKITEDTFLVQMVRI